MPEITTFPHILAAINSTTIAVLIAGYFFIRTGRRDLHKKTMMVAISLAVLFLIIYVIYHLNAGLAKFGGEGFIRPVYFTILVFHVMGAIVLVPMVPVVIWRAARGRFEDHKKLAKWTWPLWLYVSTSGVIIYVMALHIYPANG
ncbi:MAG: DUF420 domain-containing protein [Rhodospirillaceae bacterium]|jgi:putative membrane protein|nr:DUF420 domain-containing protein [Rhodospirillaceae bacterium]MBT4219265.1 DUF420 domain-containing protein [Rhodospirillaceae bacterium]MBT4463542.1 DUF420 domain-containing protein [Rhodospirillaceae bacterium]MBT5014660.1 DUF420 domain-containing protein [Rhodospirillaceae bacterium]MBT5308486.1 DUF420 domain-containing protein [Rhodospirillaceae bacterium]